MYLCPNQSVASTSKTVLYLLMLPPHLFVIVDSRMTVEPVLPRSSLHTS
jgi:hypothetical protein